MDRSCLFTIWASDSVMCPSEDAFRHCVRSTGPCCRKGQVVQAVNASRRIREIRENHRLMREWWGVQEIMNAVYVSQFRNAKTFLEDPITIHYGAQELLPELQDRWDRQAREVMEHFNMDAERFSAIIYSLWDDYHWIHGMVQLTDLLHTEHSC